MKKIFLVVLMICGRIVGAESDLERILKGAQSSDPNSQEWFVGELRKFFNSSVFSDLADHNKTHLFEILAKEGIDRQTTEIQLLVLESMKNLINQTMGVNLLMENPDNINPVYFHYLVDIAKKGLSVRNIQVRSESLNFLNRLIYLFDISNIKINPDVRNIILECALKGYKDGNSNVQRQALLLLRSLVFEQLITGENSNLVRTALESHKCYIKNYMLYDNLFYNLFYWHLPLKVFIAKNNITSDEIKVEYNIAWKTLNDKNASDKERSDAFDFLNVLMFNGLLDENIVGQFFSVALEVLINHIKLPPYQLIDLIKKNIFFFSDKPELLNQLIVVCCQGVTSVVTDVRIRSHKILMWLVDNKLIKTIDQAKLVVKAMRVGMQEADKYVRDQAFQLRESLYNKGFIQRGMLSASIARESSSKAVAQNNEPHELAKSVLRLSGVNPDKFMFYNPRYVESYM